jgi:glucan phosphoethanolaminetransferase (alkaline phosphatase superfamily)
VLKNSFFLSAFGISIFVGALSFSILFYIFSDNSSYILERYDFEKLKFAIGFWLYILITFILFAIKNYRKTNNSYKHSLSSIFITNIFLSLFFGTILFYTGLAQKADEFSTKHLNFYQKNIKITEIKKEIFLKKLKEIGITKELLKQHPELKEKIENKFNEKVLGKIYFNNTDDCEVLKSSCKKNTVFFQDKKGCGCKKIYR